MLDKIEFIPTENEIQILETIEFLSFYLTHPLNRNIWNWEFEQNKSITYISKNSNKVIGTQCIILMEFQLFGNLLMTGKTENSYFSEQYRGKGLFQKLFFETEGKASKLDVQMLWAFTPATKVYRDALGFKVFDNIVHNASIKMKFPSFKSIVTKKKLVQTLLRFGYHGAKYLTFTYKNLRAKTLSQLTSSQNPIDFKDLKELYERLFMKNYLFLPLSDVFLNWRVSKNPNLTYLTKFFYENELLRGFYIVAIDHEKNANISEIMFENEEQGIFILKDLFKELKIKKAIALNYMGNLTNPINSNVFNLLTSFGSNTKLNEGMPLVMKYIGSKENFVDHLKIEDLYINGLWTEGFHY